MRYFRQPARTALRVAVFLTFLSGLQAVDFLQDVAPALSRYGCNGSSCHGKAEGQNGFKLSVFGSDLDADYAAIVHHSRGRRLMEAAPGMSLFLLKATGEIPHEGGGRFAKGSPGYRLFLDWIKGGVPFLEGEVREAKGLRVEPAERILGQGEGQSLNVFLEYVDGGSKDVTWLAEFHTNDPGLADVDENGLVTIGKTSGKTAVLARYGGHVATFRAIVPQPGEFGQYPALPARNFIDTHIDKGLRDLNIHPAALADEPTFLRRAYLDIAGRIPTASEARAYLADPDRKALVDTLLESPGYVDYASLLWADILRVDSDALGQRDAYAYYRAIHSAIAQNVPLDEFVRKFLTATGPLPENPAGHFHRVNNKPGQTAAMAAQTFLGLRITCAECHQHPYDRWTQEDYYGFQAYFASVSPKALGANQFALLANKPPTAKHPRTGERIVAHPLGETQPEEAASGDQRPELASWMTSPENPWFSRNMANRIWARLLGRGLVEPVDDFRSTNPASHPELLVALADYLVQHNYDGKALIRLITSSHTYQLASTTSPANQNDEKNFSRALFRRLPAEVLMDAVCDATGVPEKFTRSAPGMRAVQLWDSRHEHYFLKLFGRPARVSPCECDRATGASISQALHLMNSPAIEAKLAHAGGLMARLNETFPDDTRLVDELYLTCFARYPTQTEKDQATKYLHRKAAHRQQAVQDLAWSMLNSIEFLFNH